MLTCYTNESNVIFTTQAADPDTLYPWEVEGSPDWPNARKSKHSLVPQYRRERQLDFRCHCFGHSFVGVCCIMAIKAIRDWARVYRSTRWACLHTTIVPYSPWLCFSGVTRTGQSKDKAYVYHPMVRRDWPHVSVGFPYSSTVSRLPFQILEKNISSSVHPFNAGSKLCENVGIRVLIVSGPFVALNESLFLLFYNHRSNTATDRRCHYSSTKDLSLRLHRKVSWASQTGGWRWKWARTICSGGRSIIQRIHSLSQLLCNIQQDSWRQDPPT